MNKAKNKRRERQASCSCRLQKVEKSVRKKKGEEREYACGIANEELWSRRDYITRKEREGENMRRRVAVARSLPLDSSA